jgi:prepilin-type N-terminal cleavage/methylation domain-containing protein
MRRRAFTLTELIVVIVIILALLFCLCGGFVGPVGRVLFGWAFFLYRVVPAVRPSSSTLLTAAVCLAGVTSGVHLTARWFVRALPAAPDAEPRRWSFVSTLAVVGVMVLTFTAGIGAVGVTHQVGWLASSPEPIMQRGVLRRIAAGMASSNNLKQIGVGTHDYMDNVGRLPPAATFDAHGRALHGWLTRLLPYVEQDDLFKKIDLSRPWDDPANAPHFRTQVPPYRHPLAAQEDDQGWPLTHYALNAELVNGGRPLTLQQLPRGTANTLLAGEAHGDWKPWGHPIGWRDPALGLNHSPAGFGSVSRPPRPATFVMADGSVRTFTQDADGEFLALLGGK